MASRHILIQNVCHEAKVEATVKLSIIKVAQMFIDNINLVSSNPQIVTMENMEVKDLEDHVEVKIVPPSSLSNN